MADLTVHITGSSQNEKLLTLPLDVYSPSGDRVASGTASPNRPGNLTFDEGKRAPLDRVHIVITLPSSEAIQQSVVLKNGKGEARFDIGGTVPTDWLEWVTPFQSLEHLTHTSDQALATARPIGKVWMTLWSLIEGRWQSSPLMLQDRLSDRSGVQQITIPVPENPHLLQVGGDEFGWRLVTLPPGQRVRVALTRSARESGDTIDVTVAREHPDNEIILGYLAGGAISEANRLADTLKVADRLLRDKIADPISAVAAGYFLLRNNKLSERKSWVRNLMEWFPAIADGAIISAALAAQTDGVSEAAIRRSIEIALNRGLPVFTLGATLLHRTMSAVHRGHEEKKKFHQSYLALQAYVRAACSVGPYFAFKGMSPAEPTWVSVFGPETNPGFGENADGTPLQRLVYARPATVKGRYGQTTVQLPRAPVSASAELEVVAQIALQPPSAPSLESPAVEIRRLTRRDNSRGLPIRETTFLNHLSLPSTPPAVRMRPPRSDLSSSSGRRLNTISVFSSSTPIPRQSERYWRKQREVNAVTLFNDEDEYKT